MRCHRAMSSSMLIKDLKKINKGQLETATINNVPVAIKSVAPRKLKIVYCGDHSLCLTTPMLNINVRLSFLYSWDRIWGTTKQNFSQTLMPLVKEMQICSILDRCFILMLHYIFSSLPWKTSLTICAERLSNSKIQSTSVIRYILDALGKEKTQQMLFDVIKTNCNLKRS